ncbi:hypothetical protein RJ639_014640 [Escallonia herrerae]|uniref:RING-type domain-containing protein n=2 Tax=Escallonia herrerae TaxID=1293975 RepID=A0AA89ANW0_9ASTE|nr:hypothetical protein RJ639_014640 [Escallonia herrerae]
MVDGVALAKLKRAMRKLVEACGCGGSRRRQANVIDDPPVLLGTTTIMSGSTSNPPSSDVKMGAQADSPTTTSSKNLCTICLDPLSYSTGTNPGQAIFTAQCSHAFHFACISSNVRHGGITCPICRAQWTQLPRNLNTLHSFHGNQSDPILQILDDSIATFRVHRRSFLRSAHYDDDDPIEPDRTMLHSCLHLSLLPVQVTHPSFPLRSNQTSHLCRISSRNHVNPPSYLLAESPYHSVPLNKAYLCVTLAHQPATDLVLVASPNGPHLRLIKQSMALVVFSLRPIDRLAIVTYSSAAARVFPLRRMTSYGKRTALQVIDRLFYMGQADPTEGLKKGVKILGDRTHENQRSCILHLSDSPTRSYHGFDLEAPIPVHRFHVGYGYGTSNGFVMHEFEEFLTRVLGGAIRDLQLRIGEDARIVRLRDLRGDDERRILINMADSEHVCVDYSYVEGDIDECIRTGRITVSFGDKSGRSVGTETVASVGGRTSSVEGWDYHDPYMARRWAKHLHGYRP